MSLLPLQINAGSSSNVNILSCSRRGFFVFFSPLCFRPTEGRIDIYLSGKFGAASEQEDESVSVARLLRETNHQLLIKGKVKKEAKSADRAEKNGAGSKKT